MNPCFSANMSRLIKALQQYSLHSHSYLEHLEDTERLAFLSLIQQTSCGLSALLKGPKVVAWWSWDIVLTIFYSQLIKSTANNIRLFSSEQLHQSNYFFLLTSHILWSSCNVIRLLHKLLTFSPASRIITQYYNMSIFKMRIVFSWKFFRLLWIQLYANVFFCVFRSGSSSQQLLFFHPTPFTSC